MHLPRKKMLNYTTSFQISKNLHYWEIMYDGNSKNDKKWWKFLDSYIEKNQLNTYRENTIFNFNSRMSKTLNLVFKFFQFNFNHDWPILLIQPWPVYSIWLYLTCTTYLIYDSLNDSSSLPRHNWSMSHSRDLSSFLPDLPSKLLDHNWHIYSQLQHFTQIIYFERIFEISRHNIWLFPLISLL